MSSTHANRAAWTAEREALLRQLYADGLSCGDIARRIGGISRNAVIGKVHRLGLPLRAGASPRKVARTKVRAPQWRGPPKGVSPLRATIASLRAEPLPTPQESDVARVSFIDLEKHHCRFIPGAPAGPFEPQFCGADVVPGLSWCPNHARRCFDLSRPQSYRPRTAGGTAPFDRTKALDELAEAV